MANGRPKRETCKRCNLHVSVCGKLSARGLCIECGVGSAITQHRQMAEHSGEYFKEWRRAMARSIGAILAEDVSHDAR